MASDDLTKLATQAKHRERIERLNRAKTDLFYLCGILGYTLLDDDFHGPLCKRSDDTRCKLRVADFWSRKFFKTTILTVARTIQDILIDPFCTTGIFHAVDGLASDIIKKIGEKLQHCKELRRLEPIGLDLKTGELYTILPHVNAKRFISATELTLPPCDYTSARYRPGMRDAGATVEGRGAGGETTGAHYGPVLDHAPRSHWIDLGGGVKWFTSEAVGGIHLDDFVGRKDVEDNQFPKKRQWVQNTALPMLNRNARLRVVGTRWGDDDPYDDWIKSRTWDTYVTGCIDTDQADHEEAIEVMGYKGRPVFFSEKEIRKAAEEMGAEFPAQMMNDPTPPGEIPWTKDCEQYIEGKDAMGAGFVVLLSDPAPRAIGSTEIKQRTAVEKDFWTHAIVKMRRRGQRNEIILLDGSASRDWTLREGWAEGCRLMRRWGTKYAAPEVTGQAIALYLDDFREVSRDEGVRLTILELTMTYKGKNQRWAAFCNRAGSGEFLISKTCPAPFLEVFLDQARRWRPGRKSNANSLQFDDHADVVSNAVDPVFRPRIPIVEHVPQPFSPYEDHSPGKPSFTWGTRYIRA